MQKDPLLLYMEALDRGDFDAIAELLNACPQRDELEDAASGLLLRFDSNEDFTPQLMRVREQYA